MIHHVLTAISVYLLLASGFYLLLEALCPERPGKLHASLLWLPLLVFCGLAKVAIGVLGLMRKG